MGLKKKVGSLVLCAAILGTGTAALASTAYVDGGVAKWDYGTGGGKVWSNLHHPYKTHKTSVQGAYYYDSGWIGAGKTSYASATDRWYAVDHSYWDVK
ncbi:lactococcin 972 family bacteriocin [Bacillus sp. REN3]|uniref:lactococcin 972 family bacteriocin n=1 Tax=Bacillus sp. REN3 TaxID=2802440 RepID=UPI001AEE1A1B|nr:lactococcin 972 family bacteriocin [Bacillus sp. REN3]